MARLGNDRSQSGSLTTGTRHLPTDRRVEERSLSNEGLPGNPSSFLELRRCGSPSFLALKIFFLAGDSGRSRRCCAHFFVDGPNGTARPWIPTLEPAEGQSQGQMGHIPGPLNPTCGIKRRIYSIDQGKWISDESESSRSRTLVETVAVGEVREGECHEASG